MYLQPRRKNRFCPQHHRQYRLAANRRQLLAIERRRIRSPGLRFPPHRYPEIAAQVRPGRVSIAAASPLRARESPVLSGGMAFGLLPVRDSPLHRNCNDTARTSACNVPGPGVRTADVHKNKKARGSLPGPWLSLTPVCLTAPFSEPVRPPADHLPAWCLPWADRLLEFAEGNLERLFRRPDEVHFTSPSISSGRSSFTFDRSPKAGLLP